MYRSPNVFCFTVLVLVVVDFPRAPHHVCSGLCYISSGALWQAITRRNVAGKFHRIPVPAPVPENRTDRTTTTTTTGGGVGTVHVRLFRRSCSWCRRTRPRSTAVYTYSSALLAARFSPSASMMKSRPAVIVFTCARLHCSGVAFRESG